MAVKASATITLMRVDDGDTGVGVESIVEEYYLSTSKTSQNGGSWSTSPPSWSTGKYIWTRSKITYTDGTVKYTTPSCDSSWEAVTDLQLGGRNLLLNSKPLSGDNITNNAVSAELYNNFNMSYKDNYTGTSTFDMLKFAEIYVEKLGATYTLSFLAKGSGTINVYFNGATGYVTNAKTIQSDGRTGTSGDGRSYWTLTDKWTRYWVTWTLATTGNISIEKYILFRLASRSIAYVCAPKLEIGDKASDWTPAPEDMATSEEVDNAQSSADEANDAITNTNERVAITESLIANLEECIAMLVTDENGGSLMTQTSTGWTFNMSGTTSALNEVSANLHSLQEQTGDTQSTVNKLQQAITDLEETAEYVHVRTYEDEPCLELGEDDTVFKVMVTNTRIMFYDGSSVKTYINTRGLVTENITVDNEFRQGNFMWKQRSNGNYGLQFVR